MEHFNFLAKHAETCFKQIEQQFVAHPHANHQSYTEHLLNSAQYGVKSVITGGIFITHGLFPFLFEHTGSDMVKELHETLNAKKAAATQEPETDEEL